MNDYKKVTDEWKSLVEDCEGNVSQAIGKWHCRLVELGLIESEQNSAEQSVRRKPRRMLRLF